MPSTGTGDLLARARAGEPDALNLLYERMSTRLLGFVRLKLGRELRARVESRDILQAALLKSHQRLGEFRGGDTRSLMAWLAKIVEHEIRDSVDHMHRQRRDAAREVPLEDDAPVAAITRSALSRVILNDEAQRLEAAIESLSADHRTVILLRKFEGLSFAEIGQRMARNEDACRMLLARAMTALTLRLAGAPR
jgi:RNA polymerase sigma-70 factor (subfamily 1)